MDGAVEVQVRSVTDIDADGPPRPDFFFYKNIGKSQQPTRSRFCVFFTITLLSRSAQFPSKVNDMSKTDKWVTSLSWGTANE